MKIEPRGKYAGVKVHLDGDEAKEFLQVFQHSEKHSGVKGLLDETQLAKKVAVPFAIKLGGKIAKLLKEEPKLLEDRDETQIAASLQSDLDKILAQQHAMSAGKDWKKVKV